MCRHLAYLGPETTAAALLIDPPHGLYPQSWAPRRQRHGTVNADGFGIGWYLPTADEPPARYRRAVPVWADPNLPDLARTVRTRALLAAVRSATEGTAHDEAAAAPSGTGTGCSATTGPSPTGPGCPPHWGRRAGSTLRTCSRWRRAATPPCCGRSSAGGCAGANRPPGRWPPYCGRPRPSARTPG